MWIARLADAYAEVEARGEMVAEVHVRFNVRDGIKSATDRDGHITTLWGARVVVDDRQKEPFKVTGTTP